MSKKNKFSVVIVGAGPVGLVGALRLSMLGIDVLIVDKASHGSNDLRASTFHPPTLEMLDQLQVFQKLSDLGIRCPTWQIRLHETGESATFDLSILKTETEYPYRLQAEQSKLCEIIRQELLAKAVPFWQSCEVVAIEQTSSQVTLVSYLQGEKTLIEADFVLACDGAHSALRSCTKLSFEGITYPETTIVATTNTRFEDYLPSLASINYTWSNFGTYTLLRLPDRWRVSLHIDQGETIETAIQPSTIESKLQRIYNKGSAYVVFESRAYTIHKKLLNNFQEGRVLFAGDSAHLTSPSGGMGMNGGIHDVWYACTLLNQVYQKQSLTPLQSYTAHRRPIVEYAILAQADENRKRMNLLDPIARVHELKRLQDIAHDKVACKKFLMKTSMLEAFNQRL
ncbi:MAG: NAD(P)/FAD-dependent oxidoreductase [Methylacidiphilales bacterium]|nr:NAD(P)/FAD-dependent oxidoreductase [Candidatus Methylacidiphilales bacterium]